MPSPPRPPRDAADAPLAGRGEGAGEGSPRGGTDPEALLRRMFAAAVDAVGAETCVPPALPDPAGGRTVVVGAGKAAARDGPDGGA